MDNATSFFIKARSSTESELDTNVFRVGTAALVELAKWNGVPDRLASTLGQTVNLALDFAEPHKFSVVSNEQLELADGLYQETAFEPLNLRSTAGPIIVSVRAYLSPVASAVKPYPNAVPDFSRMPAQYALSWNIGDQKLPFAVDLATNGKWSRYMAENDVAKLDALCEGVQSDLVLGGFSTSDASILAWIMTETHPNAAGVNLIELPNCLKQKQPELARFGVTTIKPVDSLKAPTGPVVGNKDVSARKAEIEISNKPD